MGLKETLEQKLADKAWEKLAQQSGMSVDELKAVAAPSPLSVGGHPCPKCAQPSAEFPHGRITQMMIPEGSTKFRCPVCEPEQLWDDAYKAWKLANPTSPW